MEKSMSYDARFILLVVLMAALLHLCNTATGTKPPESSSDSSLIAEVDLVACYAIWRKSHPVPEEFDEFHDALPQNDTADTTPQDLIRNRQRERWKAKDNLDFSNQMHEILRDHCETSKARIVVASQSPNDDSFCGIRSVNFSGRRVIYIHGAEDLTQKAVLSLSK